MFANERIEGALDGFGFGGRPEQFLRAVNLGFANPKCLLRRLADCTGPGMGEILLGGLCTNYSVLCTFAETTGTGD
ncbi:MAG: hypothetical protein NZ585_14780 [Chloracidobacterium sp.]|nr:hypothetical protein [Chloracidobacterium sp.]MDW8217971.1 hypothetical protein [Acidobacteriota bacterium]